MAQNSDNGGDDEIREMITAEEVLGLIHISRTTLWRLEMEGLFPQGILLTPHRKLWFKDEVIKWQRDLQDPNSDLSRRIRERDDIATPERPAQKQKRRQVTTFDEIVAE